MRIDAMERVRRTARRIKIGVRPRAIILLYHRVAALPSDPYLLCVSPRHFAEHLEVLRRSHNVIPLKRLVSSVLDGDIRRRSVAVTFDDGYADNLYNAKPLLEQYDTTATVFVTTGQIGRGHEFWWDELEKLLLQPGPLPSDLELRVNGGIHRWQLRQASRYSEETWNIHRNWNVEIEAPGPRQGMFRDLYDLLQPLPPEDLRQALYRLQQWAGVERSSRPTHRTMTGDEVVGLASGGLVEIGAHTVSHPILSAMPETLQWNEIRQGRLELERLLGYPVKGFSYPYGLRSTYTNETVAFVREAGFDCACSNFTGLAGSKTDRFQLPRFVVQDCDGDAFARFLRDSWVS